jgi:hypothetical protein
MRQRGRPSQSSLSVVVPIKRGVNDGRPQPPANLDKDEARHWRVYVDRMPADWFPAETLPVLAQLCADVVMSERVSAELRKVRRRSLAHDADFKRFAILGRMELRFSQSIANLSTKLRLTNQSRLRSERAAQDEQKARHIKPWDIGTGANESGADNRLDSESVSGARGEVDWSHGGASGLAEAGDNSDLRQPGRDAAGDPEFREKERQERTGIIPDAGASSGPAETDE